MIAETKNGFQVFDRPQSHIHGDILHYIQAAIACSEWSGDFEVITYDFGHTIGHSHCVETDVDDIIVYKQRPGRTGLSRMVLGRKPEPCSLLTFVLCPRRMGGAVLITAFIGGKPEPEMWDEGTIGKDPRGADAARKASVRFWENHALIAEE